LREGIELVEFLLIQLRKINKNIAELHEKYEKSPDDTLKQLSNDGALGMISTIDYYEEMLEVFKTRYKSAGGRDV
jgi:hypothetical protein